MSNRWKEVRWPCTYCGAMIVGIEAYGIHVAEHERMKKIHQEWLEKFAQLTLHLDGSATK